MTPPDMTSPDDDYAVGYGKPPKHTRFQPGRSGNPRGRPKGAVNLGTSLHEALNERVPVTENGRTRKIRKIDLMIKVALNRAIKGDARALNAVITLMQRSGVGVSEPAVEAETFGINEAEALARYIADCRPEVPVHDA